jgi:hypothetical protein
MTQVALAVVLGAPGLWLAVREWRYSHVMDRDEKTRLGHLSLPSR